MRAFQLEPAANEALDSIYDYTANVWGDAQADDYIAGLFEEFRRIAHREVIWRHLPANFGLDAFGHRWGRHVIYWRTAADGDILILAVLHERMHQIARLRETLDDNP